MVCRDEMCSPFVKEVTLHFGECFDMRGLGGFITCGNTGFGAAHGHSPIVDDRRRFVYFVAPHIAIDESGSVRTHGGPITPSAAMSVTALANPVCAVSRASD